jgi:hypothetical protein
MLVPSGIHAKYRIFRNAESPCNPRFSRAFNPKITHSIPRRPIFFNASTPGEIDAAFVAITRERMDALFIGGEAFFSSRGVQLAPAARAWSCPSLRFPGRVVPSVPDARPHESIFCVNPTQRRATPQRQPGYRRSVDYCMTIASQPLETLACKPVSVACEPSLWPLLAGAPGNGFRTPETERPKTASEQPFFLAETGSRPMRPRKIAGIRRKTGNLK